MEPVLSNSAEVFSKPNCTVRVMTEKVGFDEVINNDSGVSGGTSGGFKELVTDLTEGFRWKGGHNGSSTKKAEVLHWSLAFSWLQID